VAARDVRNEGEREAGDGGGEPVTDYPAAAAQRFALTDDLEDGTRVAERRSQPAGLKTMVCGRTNTPERAMDAQLGSVARALINSRCAP